MNIFLDVEFNGYGGQLLSIGMVADDRRFFYRELNLYGRVNSWVARNVAPVLRNEPKTLSVIQFDLKKFLMQYKSIHIIVDWPDDIKYFCDLLITGPGTRIDTPSLTMEIRRDIDSTKSAIPHNALADARAIRLAYHKVMKKTLALPANIC